MSRTTFKKERVEAFNNHPILPNSPFGSCQSRDWQIHALLFGDWLQLKMSCRRSPSISVPLHISTSSARDVVQLGKREWSILTVPSSPSRIAVSLTLNVRPETGLQQDSPELASFICWATLDEKVCYQPMYTILKVWFDCFHH